MSFSHGVKMRSWPVSDLQMEKDNRDKAAESPGRCAQNTPSLCCNVL